MDNKSIHKHGSSEDYFVVMELSTLRKEGTLERFIKGINRWYCKNVSLMRFYETYMVDFYETRYCRNCHAFYNVHYAKELDKEGSIRFW